MDNRYRQQGRRGVWWVSQLRNFNVPFVLLHMLCVVFTVDYIWILNYVLAKTTLNCNKFEHVKQSVWDGHFAWINVRKRKLVHLATMPLGERECNYYLHSLLVSSDIFHSIIIPDCFFISIPIPSWIPPPISSSSLGGINKHNELVLLTT